MHPSAYQLMEVILPRATGEGRLLDVGSYNVNGTYKPLAEERGWDYLGLDLVLGPNVDVVAEEFDYPFADNTFDAVISGSTMEHVTAIWRWVPELVRILKLGGPLVIITHWAYPVHPHPVDCWRIMPDGMRYLFDLTGGLEKYDVRITSEVDIFGMAYKKGAQ